MLKKTKTNKHYLKTDAVIKALTTNFVKEFEILQAKLGKDELNTLQAVNETYERIDTITRETLTELAKSLYYTYLTDDMDTFEDLYVLRVFSEISPLTKYSYTNEVDRKRSRCFEACVVSEDLLKTLDTNLVQWSKMVNQYADIITRESVVKAYMDSGYTKGQWETEEDNRVCKDCEELDGKIFPLDEIPTQPHWGCRCWITPIR